MKPSKPKAARKPPKQAPAAAPPAPEPEPAPAPEPELLPELLPAPECLCRCRNFRGDLRLYAMGIADFAAKLDRIATGPRGTLAVPRAEIIRWVSDLRKIAS